MVDGPFFWAFLLPNHIQLAKNLQRILDSGIFDSWKEESMGLYHSARVQDRCRVKSRNYIERDAHRKIEEGSKQLSNKYYILT